MTSLLRPLAVLVSLIPLANAAYADGKPSGAPAPSRAPQPAANQPASRATGPAQRSPASPSSARAPQVPLATLLAPIDLATVPEPCKPLAKQAVAPTPSVAFQARISLASCMADRAIAPLELCDCGASIVAIDAAVAPAIALLDNLIEVADPATQLIAEHAEGQLYLGFVNRMGATVPALSPGAGEAETTLRDMRKQTLAVQLAPWREAAMASFQHVIEIARARPELASNRVVTAAVRDSEKQLATAEVATR